MMTIAQLLAPVTSAQIRATMVTGLQALGIPADKWKAGGVASTMLTVVSTTAGGFSTLLLQAIQSGFLETATGPWLVIVALYVYGVIAPVATFATGSVTLTNSGGGVYSFAAGAATFLNSTTGQTYTNTNAFTLNALSTLSIPVTATSAGAAGSANPGQIDTLVTVMLGVTVTNPLSVVGSDAISDANLRLLCLAKLGTLSLRGPRNAYSFAVLTAINASGAPVNINRINRSAFSSTGIVNVYVASPQGAPSAQDLTAAQANVELVARPDAVTANVIAATTVLYAPTITVWVQQTPGLVATDVKTAVDNAITQYIANFPIGGVLTDQGQGLWGTGIDAVAGGAWPGIFSIEGSTDLALVAGQVPIWGGNVVIRIVAVN